MPSGAVFKDSKKWIRYSVVTNNSTMRFTAVVAILLIAVTLCDFGTAKVYQRCELVRELRNKYKLPANQIPTWTCIAFHESRYNTAITSKPNRNGSRDHGIFQINDKYWCSPPGKGCGVSCAAVKTNDITRAVACVRKIWAEWQRIHKNGFKAWSTYSMCNTPAKVNKFVANC